MGRFQFQLEAGKLLCVDVAVSGSFAHAAGVHARVEVPPHPALEHLPLQGEGCTCAAPTPALTTSPVSCVGGVFSGKTARVDRYAELFD